MEKLIPKPPIWNRSLERGFFGFPQKSSANFRKPTNYVEYFENSLKFIYKFDI